MAIGGKFEASRSSLPYQMILFCNGWYFGLFFVAEILIFVYKGEVLPYPYGALPAEVVLLFVLAGLEVVRLYFGKKGNLTERVMSVVMSIIFSVISLLGCIYLLLWQTYVLRIEVILVAIQLALIALETVFAIISVITFARSTAY